MSAHLVDAWRRRIAGYETQAYRGVPVHFKDRETGLEFVEAAAKRSWGLVAQLLMEQMATAARDHWWAAGDQPDEEAGRWWTTDLAAAYQYSRGIPDEDDFLVVPVLLTATYSDDDPLWDHTEDSQGHHWFHLDAGTPIKITSVEADLPTAETLADWHAEVESQGEYAVHNAISGYASRNGTDFIKLPIATIRTTAVA